MRTEVKVKLRSLSHLDFNLGKLLRKEGKLLKKLIKKLTGL